MGRVLLRANPEREASSRGHENPAVGSLELPAVRTSEKGPHRTPRPHYPVEETQRVCTIPLSRGNVHKVTH